jgi:hypothetical protein
MKRPGYSPVYAVGLAVSLLVLLDGIAVTSDEHGPRIVTMRFLCLLGGAWIAGRYVVRRSVTVWVWQVKGPLAFILATIGGLLASLSAYCLLHSILQ